jgi:hypothetical protein
LASPPNPSTTSSGNFRVTCMASFQMSGALARSRKKNSTEAPAKPMTEVEPAWARAHLGPATTGGSSLRKSVEKLDLTPALQGEGESSAALMFIYTSSSLRVVVVSRCCPWAAPRSNFVSFVCFCSTLLL